VDTVNWFLNHADDISLAVTATISAASTIAALTPTPKDDNAIKYVRNIVNMLALNVRHANPNKKTVLTISENQENSQGEK
jgi:hypothetical protein